MANCFMNQGISRFNWTSILNENLSLKGTAPSICSARGVERNGESASPQTTGDFAP
jgi:hypothetical protein